MPEAAIALSLGIDIKTLKKHCLMEIEIGRWARCAELIDYFFEASAKGNVAAMKALFEMQRVATAEHGIGASKPTEPDPDEKPAQRPERLGKKVIAQIEAENAGKGTAWGNDLDPTSRSH